MHIKIFNDAQWQTAKTALEAAGHEVVEDTKSNVFAFITKLETEFPETYALIKKGIADAKDSTKSGGDRAVEVATDVLAAAPVAIKELAGAKDALVAAVTVTFANEVSDFKTVASSLIAKL